MKNYDKDGKPTKIDELSVYNEEGKPIKIDELDIEGLAEFLYKKRIRTVQGKLIQPLHIGHKEVIADPARFKVLAAGRRWGKCNSYEDTITLADGSVEKIKNLIGKEFEVYSVDGNLNSIKTKAYCVDNGIKPIYKIKTKYGLELYRTKNHPLFTSEGWATIQDGGLVEGIRIAVPRKLPHEGKITKDDNLIKLLAYLIGDGSISQKTYSFCNNNPTILEDFKKSLDGTYREKKEENVTTIFLHKNNKIYQLIEELNLHGKTSHFKFIPNWIYTCPNYQISLFLNRLFSCDGWACENEIGYCSASKELILGIKRLLSRLGITSSINLKVLGTGNYAGNEYYQLRVNNYSELVKFRSIVNIIGKQEAIDKCLTKSKNSFNSQLQTLPKEFCKDFSKKLQLNMSLHKQEKLFGRVRSDRAVNRDKLLSYVELFEERFKEEKVLLNPNIYWDEIVNIKYIGDMPTAGLSVPVYHNYINDCLEHNTLLTSLIALAVLMQINRRVWVVAPDYGLTEKVYRELYNILVNQLKMIKPGKRGGGRARFQKGDYYLETPWGSVLEGKSMERPDSLAGEANDLVIVDEAALQPNLGDIWTQMLEPTLMDKEGSAIMISTPRGKNDFYKYFLFGQTGKRQKEGLIDIVFDEESGVDNDLRDWSSFQKSSYDNPLLASNVEKSKEELDKKYRMAVIGGTVTKFKQEYYADFEAVADSAFPGFIVEKTDKYEFPNVVNYNWNPDEGPILAACDHNFAKPASTIFAQVNRMGDVVIFDERFTPRTTSYMQAQQILDKQTDLVKAANVHWDKAGILKNNRIRVGFQAVVADISGNQVQLNGRAAWDDFESVLGVRPVGLKQDRETGCNMLRTWMQFPLFDQKGSPILNSNGEIKTFPKLFVSSNCVNLIYALSTAVFKKGRHGNLKEDYDETPQGYEGLIDALRYLIVYLFHDSGQHFTLLKGVQ